MERKLTIILDTSALVYWTLDPEKLTARAEKAIASADVIRISSISIWEIGIKINRGSLVIPLPLRTYVEKLKLVDRLEIVPVTVEIWLKNLELRWKHRDPADRTIVATANLSRSRLVTSDKKIRRYHKESVW